MAAQQVSASQVGNTALCGLWPPLVPREGLQFPAPAPGLRGFGVRIGGPPVFTFTIGKLHLPTISTVPNTLLIS